MLSRRISSCGRRFGRRHVLWAVTGAGMGTATALALACRGSGKGKEPTAGTIPSETAAGQATAAPERPKRGGTLALIWTPGEGPQNLDPHVVSHAAVASGTGGIGTAYSRLVRLKTVPETPPPMLTEVVGDTAERWEQPDDTTYIFTLRKGIKYHNVPPVNGREWTSGDLVFSWNRQRAKTVLAGSIAGMKWTAVDKYTVKLESETPDADFLLRICGIKVDIAREVVEAKNDDLKDGPVIGTGAWLFKEWRYNELVRMARNPDYFLPGLPYMDELVVYRIADPATAVAAMRTKQALAYSGIPSDIRQLTATNRNIRSGKVPTAGTWLMLNQDKPPMNDLRVRQAISKALDRQAIYDSLDGLWNWGGALSFLPPGAELPADAYRRLLAHDPKEARALLRAAGVTSWKPELLVFQTTGTIDAAEVMVQQLKAVGVEPIITPIDGNRYISINQQGRTAQYDMFLMTRFVATPNNDLLGSIHSEGLNNILKLNDSQLDSMIERQASMMRDTDGRKRLLHDIQR